MKKNQRRRLVRRNIILENQIHETDVGSNSVQISLLDESIEQLKKHVSINKKDLDAIRSLKQLVYKFKRLSKMEKEIEQKRQMKNAA